MDDTTKTEWCDECGHEVGYRTRLKYVVEGRVLCGKCYEEMEDSDE